VAAFLVVQKNDSNRSESAYLGDGAVLELAGNSRELRELGGLLRREEIILNVSFASSVFAGWLRETRLIFATRVKGIINTHVGCKFTRDRKKKKTSARARARINEREPCEIHLARLL
jgi:hypothetical protein